jgi:hypothetical protein
MCEKKKYPSKKIASEVVSIWKRRAKNKSWNAKGKIPKRVYYCDKCKCWHITSQLRE